MARHWLVRNSLAAGGRTAGRLAKWLAGPCHSLSALLDAIGRPRLIDLVIDRAVLVLERLELTGIASLSGRDHLASQGDELAGLRVDLGQPVLVAGRLRQCLDLLQAGLDRLIYLL